ncbi:DHHC zinc finger domain-containing protein [Cryptosporidium ubiquitum]|uniref:Palmitoyltransferase n=1 Tax=Cryptosporidium ubiquitum TaxID=857276 RepID=A0A1J4MQS9_9CRYT|nr:DHHC zinc finger domain-containing protein [Cryptosporidium ubiquitum]OII75253.1 DHHC zinc finger domain-containing protein [Cryptosporidium ubiquitum]
MEEKISITKYLPFIFHLLPLLQIGISKAFRVESKFQEGIRDFIIIHSLFILYKISLFKSFFTDAGRVPVTEEWRNTPDPKLIFERKDDGRLRFCKYELVYKPDRAHYCRQLNRNVLRMDHYCPWFGNCIGYFNYKFFFLALLYGCASLIYMMLSQINTLSNIWNDTNVTFGHLYLISLGICFSAVLIIIVVPFFLFHAYITSRNETTIEFCEKRSKEKVSIKLSSIKIQPLPTFYSTYFQGFTYDQGIYKNIQSVFGENPLLWLVPVGLPPSDGLFFPVKKIDKEV